MNKIYKKHNHCVTLRVEPSFSNFCLSVFLLLWVYDTHYPPPTTLKHSRLPSASNMTSLFAYANIYWVPTPPPPPVLRPKTFLAAKIKSVSLASFLFHTSLQNSSLAVCLSEHLTWRGAGNSPSTDSNSVFSVNIDYIKSQPRFSQSWHWPLATH